MLLCLASRLATVASEVNQISSFGDFLKLRSPVSVFLFSMLLLFLQSDFCGVRCL